MTQYVIDAFTDRLFGGNPAAVCILDHWPKDTVLQNITTENNLSETAFAVKEGSVYRLRWFTPGGEIDLCGHATLATAFVLMNVYEPAITAVHFQTLSGELVVRRNEDVYEMEFPAYSLVPTTVTEAMEQAIGFRPVEAWLGRDLVCVLESEEQVRAAQPDLEQVKSLEGLLLHLTASSGIYDCVSRSFGPKLALAEDPVCDSGHCHIAPLWSKKKKQNALTAYQASSRGGMLYCRIEGDRVYLAGKAVLYAKSEIYVTDTFQA